MAIINRLTRLFSADFNAVLDHLEEPQILLKQSLREMEEELAILEKTIRHTRNEFEELKNKKSSAEKNISKTDEEIKICFNNDNDNLARNLIKRKLETSEILRVVSERSEQLTIELNSMSQLYEEQSTIYESMYQKAELMCVTETNKTMEFSENLYGINESDIEVALLQEKKKYYDLHPELSKKGDSK